MSAYWRGKFGQPVGAAWLLLVTAGIPRRDAELMAEKEFALYDLIEVEPETGWVRIRGMTFHASHDEGD